jgi:hypothetical protein
VKYSRVVSPRRLVLILFNICSFRRTEVESQSPRVLFLVSADEVVLLNVVVVAEE